MMVSFGLLFSLVSQTDLATAQAFGDTVRVAPGQRYQASRIHRFFLGATYRDLWATPITVPVLDLGAFEGGLTAYEKGGSHQSRSLRFRSPDGRVFVFRALDKDPTQTWPPMLRKSPARKFAEDQTSALFPAGALTVSALEKAAGLLHTEQTLVVLPDDERLGKWRDEFKDNVGLLEQRVRGTGEDISLVPGAREVIDSEHLYERLVESGTNRVDQRGFLTARLFDLVVGDWDRHGDQWNWARFDEGVVQRWVPMPRDRDWALSRLDGPIYSVIRFYLPQYQSFDGEYGSIYGMTLNAQALDRRLLTALPWQVWDSVVATLQARLTDSAIAAAVAELPGEYPPKRVQELAAALRSRRDALPEAARRFYRQLAGRVELRGSNDPERATLERQSDGSLLVRVIGPSAVLHERRFDPEETREVRLYLFGGADTVRVTGSGPARIAIRVIGGGGPNVLLDSTGQGNIRVHDDSLSTEVAATGWVGLHRHPYTSPVPVNSPLVMHRDWGWLPGLTPWLEYGPEAGLMVGGGPVITHYGFRKLPYRSRWSARIGYASGAPGINADFRGDIRFERPDLALRFRAATLNYRVQRYFGSGNETERTEGSSFYRAPTRENFFEPELEKRLGKHGAISLNAIIKATDTDLDRPTLLQLDRPYGTGQFTEAGFGLTGTLDTRDNHAHPNSGVRLVARANLFPGLFDVEETFALTRLEGTAYMTAASLPAVPTLALRAGAEKDWGRVPFFERASLGGRRSLRGFDTRRFVGDASVYGNAEVRLDFGGFTLLLPGEWGIYGLADVGRVYLDGEESNLWHTSVGGGLWFAFFDRRGTVTVTYAKAPDERARVYLRSAFHY